MAKKVTVGKTIFKIACATGGAVLFGFDGERVTSPSAI